MQKEGQLALRSLIDVLVEGVETAEKRRVKRQEKIEVE